MKVVLDSPLDMHLHLRDKAMLDIVAPLSARSFSAALVMPNLVPPVTTREGVLEYKKRIKKAVGSETFEPLMTLFFSTHYNYDFLLAMKEHILAIKLYPAGITTNSESGVMSLDVKTLGPVLEAMEALGIPLCVHGETNGFVMDREKEFIPIYENLARNFPDLKIVMEHITTKEAVEVLERYENLYATITLHHLMITLDDVAGGLLRPHLFCKPIAKRPEDKKALLSCALSAHPKVMFGSDSAPHPKDKKESSGCVAGIFSAPVALQMLCSIFEKHDALESLQHFVSNNARGIYGFNPPAKRVVLAKTPFEIPALYGDVVPFGAKETIEWSIESVS